MTWSELSRLPRWATYMVYAWAASLVYCFATCPSRRVWGNAPCKTLIFETLWDPAFDGMFEWLLLVRHWFENHFKDSFFSVLDCNSLSGLAKCSKLQQVSATYWLLMTRLHWLSNCSASHHQNVWFRNMTWI